MSNKSKSKRQKPKKLAPSEVRAELEAAMQSLNRTLIERAVTTPEEDRPVIDRVYAQWRSVTSATNKNEARRT